MRLLASVALLLFVAASQAEIRYTVTPMPEQGKLDVRMSFEAKVGPIELQMPNWSPGAYVFSAPGKNVTDFGIVGQRGTAFEIQHPADNSWKTDAVGGTMTVEYTVPALVDNGAMHFSGPSTYLYIVGRKEESCRLTVNVPPDWKIAVGLDGAGNDGKDFKARTYDVLADNPVTMGDFIEYTYTSFGRPVTIALRGQYRSNVDKDRIISVCKGITDAEGDFFGGAPFSKYVWHFAVTPASDGGGGLEHLSSTQISLARGVGPRSVRVCAHEFFHVWNVKRIRAKVLGPFDYTQLPKTGALYWLEGVTDYYASLLTFRYGLLDEEAFKGDLVNNLTAVRANEARLRVSPYDSSLRVSDTNNGLGNSNGYEISYYNLGWLVGLCLDIEIRSRTGGKKSLDDVERALWRQCKDDKPGFEEGDIRKHVVEVGGEAMGPVFDSLVMKPGEMPLETELAKVGFQLTHEDVPLVDVGFDMSPAFRSTDVRVVRVRESAKAAGLRADDVIVSINGTLVTGDTGLAAMTKANQVVATLKAGQSATVRVRRGGQEQNLIVTPVMSKRTTWHLTDVANGDRDMLSLRNGWYYAGKR